MASLVNFPKGLGKKECQFYTDAFIKLEEREVLPTYPKWGAAAGCAGNFPKCHRSVVPWGSPRTLTPQMRSCSLPGDVFFCR